MKGLYTIHLNRCQPVTKSDNCKKLNLPVDDNSVYESVFGGILSLSLSLVP